MQYEIIPATSCHAAIVAANIRQEDKDELAMLGQSPLYAIVSSLNASVKAWTGIVDGMPICIFGVSEWPDGTGRPWMIGTIELEANQRIFLRKCKNQVEEMQSHYNTLQNYVCVHNLNAINWLRWLGFKMLDVVPYGLNGEQFQRFQWQRSDTAQ